MESLKIQKNIASWSHVDRAIWYYNNKKLCLHNYIMYITLQKVLSKMTVSIVWEDHEDKQCQKNNPLQFFWGKGYVCLEEVLSGS